MDRRKKLGEILVEAGVIKPRQLAEALEDQKRYGGKLGTILLERRYISEKQYFNALTAQLGVPAIDFTRSTVPEKVAKLIPQELAERHNVFPVAQKITPKGKVIVLAMADPTDVTVQDEITFTTGFKVEPALALESTIKYVIRDYYFHQQGKGSYRLEHDMDIGPGAAEQEESTFQIENAKVSEPYEPEIISPPEDKDQAEEKPKLTRELRALLKLLAKKGLINSKEYLDTFKETE